jgi:hypothetical protein
VFIIKAISALSAVFVAVAGPAYADPWSNIYMTDTGGSRLLQTDDPAEALYVWASVTSPNGAVLVVQCPYSSGLTTISLGQRGSIDGPNYLSNDSSVYFTVDDNRTHAARGLHYIQGSYSMTIPNQLLQEMAEGITLVMSYGPTRSDKRVFTLSGSNRAISAIDCTRLD